MMLFSKPRNFILFSACLLTANADTLRGVQQRMLSTDENAAELGAVGLGTAGNYAILTKTGISTVPASSITGDIAVSPIAATAMTGFSLTSADDGKASTSAQVTGKAFGATYIAPTPSVLTTAVGDMETAYTNAAGRQNIDAEKKDLGAGGIGGLTLTQMIANSDVKSGVYTFGSSVTISTDLTIDGLPEDIFIIQMTGDLLLAANKKVILSGGILPQNVFWQVAGNVKVMAGAHMEGILLVKTGVVFNAGSSLNGRVLAQTACTLMSATITEPTEA